MARADQPLIRQSAREPSAKEKWAEMGSNTFLVVKTREFQPSSII